MTKSTSEASTLPPQGGEPTSSNKKAATKTWLTLSFVGAALLLIPRRSSRRPYTTDHAATQSRKNDKQSC